MAAPPSLQALVGAAEPKSSRVAWHLLC